MDPYHNKNPGFAFGESPNQGKQQGILCESVQLPSMLTPSEFGLILQRQHAILQNPVEISKAP